MRPLADHVARAGFMPATPVVVARAASDGAVEAFASGIWPGGSAVTVDDPFYSASLAKQVTGAAAALLVRDGKLDPDQPISSLLTDLPVWTGTINPRQLAHHIAGLPGAGELEASIEGHWTEPAAMAALQSFDGPAVAPGERYAYANIGYILLARIVGAVSGMPFGDFVATRLLAPHNLTGLSFTSDVSAFPQIALMGPRLPLTHGDGGLWSTAPAFARWLQLQNTNAFGLAAIVETPGRLTDGTEVDYGWGIGLRRHHGHALSIHAGEWAGAVAKAVRCPALGVGIVAMAAGAPYDSVDRLVASLLSES